LLCLTIFPIFGKETVNVITVPKCGTHCIIKYFRLLEHLEKSSDFAIRISHFNSNRTIRVFRFNEDSQRHFESDNERKIILVRDLRDMFLSTLPYIQKTKNWLWIQAFFAPGWKELSFEEKLLELMDFEKNTELIQWERKGLTLPQQIKSHVEEAIEFSSKPNTLQVKFEDLSGNHGEYAQRRVMREINSFIGVSLTEEEENFLIENLFGNKLYRSPTFRNGKSYVWKEVMTPLICERFKDLYGENLIDLGYENDLNWQSDLEY
jgi:hypothetical protein